MKTNNLNAYTQALGALKLISIFLNCPGVISRATLVGASTDSIRLLKSMPVLNTELAEVFRCVNNVIFNDQVAYVTPTNSTAFPFGAVIVDKKGHVCAAAIGNSKTELGERIRLKLLSQKEQNQTDAA
ncbi:hypothetical protein ACIOWE_03355 [Pseudomonas sp. NPDC087598]|uniref:hypothetical protein n=1 Tax=Pseudomonas sp. NPDC087598 TaxID=3364440 RepID=UPI0038189854